MEKGTPHAKLLAALSAESLKPILGPARVKQITDALEKGSAALPVERLREVIGLLMTHQRGALYAAFARKRLPELEAAAAPLLAEARDDNDFAATFFLAALEAGALQPAAALARVLGRTVNMPGVAKQAPKVEAAPEVVAVARDLLGRFAPTRTGLCQPFQLVYGLVGLLAKEGSPASIAAIEAFTARAALKDETAERQTLRILEAVGQGDLTASFTARLAASEQVRKTATESQSLSETLGLPMRDEKDWSASIWIGEGVPTEWFGLLQETWQVHLTLRPAAVPDWTVTLRGPEDQRVYDCRGGDTFRNDLAVPRLHELAAFPRWLVDAGAALKVTFSAAEAKVNIGRKSSGAPLIRAWLAAGRPQAGPQSGPVASS